MFLSDYYPSPEIITPDDDMHYFFGYYDMRAFSNGRHLALRVPFMDRLPTENDWAEIGYLEKKQFTPFAKTTAWNFQQAAMQQWHPYKDNTVFYNSFVDGKCITVTHNIETGEKLYTERATACVSPNGKWGLAINYGRIFSFRPGYGYAGYVDEYANINHPEKDGVFLVDMETGKAKLLVNYKEIGAKSGFDKTQKILINHITFNTSSNTYCMLVRNFGAWTTSLMVGDLNGNIRTVLENTYVSHYVWRDEKHLIAHCTTEGEEKNMYCINMDNGTYEKWDMQYFHESGNPDIHCNTIAGCDYVIGDGYPKGGYRYLMAYSIKTGASRELFRCKTVIPTNGDIRCDLHARFIDNGKFISFDTTMDNRRQIALIPTTALNF